jgi:L-ascorbate metabolism protein UlaG (beta-lactamase superfamily)
MMEINFLRLVNHSAFIIKDKGKTIYIDPFKVEGSEKADIIFITHPHFDHMNMEDIRKIAGKDTTIVLPKDSIDKIDFGKKIAVEPNKAYTVDGIKFRTIPAYNVVESRLKNHPKENRWVGYIIEVDGKTIYHAGDTDFIEEMKGLNADVALIPIGGTYVMSVEEAIPAANSLNAKVVIPMHYKALLGKEGSKKAEEKFLKEVKNARILIEIQEQKYSFQ